MKLYIIFILILIFYLCIYSFNNTELFTNQTYILPKVIYCYWNDLSNNPIINKHIETWTKHIPSDWKINIIHNNNLHNYVSKQFIDKYKKLDPVRFSDFLRLELLKNNGGVWLDASIIIVNGKFLDTYYNEMIKNQYDATLYELKEKTTMTNAPYIENWFIMAPKNSKLINDLYTEFIKSESIGFLKYKKDIILPSKINLTGTLGYGDGTYLMQHAIINYLFTKNKPNYYNVNIKDSYKSMFKIHDDHKWDHKKVIDFIIKNKDWSNYYAIKLTNNSRGFITKDNLKNYITAIEHI